MRNKLKTILAHSPKQISKVVSKIRPELQYDLFYYDMKKSDGLTSSQIDELQDKKLKAMIVHCSKHVPYYKKLFNDLNLKPHKFRSKEDLELLPIMDRSDVIKNSKYLISKKNLGSKPIIRYSSGTTGNSLKFVSGQTERLFEAARIRKQADMAGIDIRKGHYRLGLHLGDKIQKHDVARKTIFFNTKFLATKSSIYVNSMINKKYKCIKGYPSHLYFLSEAINEDNSLNLGLRAAITVSENLSDSLRKRIEKKYGCQVFNHYGMTEQVTSAMECQSHGGMHIEPLHGFIEQESEILVGTTLMNFSMPLLRYKTGDKIKIIKNKCSCGRYSNRITKINGREAEFLLSKSGKIYDFFILSNMVRNNKNIIICQFIQDEPGYVLVRLKLTNNKLSKIRHNLNGIFKNDMHFIMEKTNTFGKDKFQFIISKPAQKLIK